MPDITANAPDGTKHVFPDGTDPAVIDRAMKQYITGGTAATGQPDQDVFQRHARGTNPALTKWASENPQAAEEDRQGVTRGAWENIGNLATGLVDAGKQVMFPKGANEWERLKDIWGNVVQKPLEGEQQKAQQTQGAESFGHSLASYVPILGPMASGAGEAFGRRDVGGGAVLGGASLLGARGAGAVDEGLTAKVSDAEKAIHRNLAIDKGKVSVVNDMVRKPLAMLHERVMGQKGEISQSVNSVLSADEMDMQAKSNQMGFVDTTKAVGKARAVLGNTMKALPEGAENQILRAESRPMIPLREAKSFATDVGGAAAALERAGKYREAAALNALYDGLRDATTARAQELGAPQAKLWQHYIDETRTYKGMQGGLLGELVDEPNHTTALTKLIDPKRAAEAGEIKEALDKYGIDSKSFSKAQQLGVDLNRYSQETKANFFGKLKAIIKHPLTAGPAAVGAAAVGGASGVPGLGFVLPIIVAGKVANMLDAADMAKLLKEIQKTTAAGSERVGPPLEGPIDKPAPPSAGPQSPPSAPPGGWKGGINPSGVEQTLRPVSTADKIQALRVENSHLKDRLRVAGEGIYSDEEVQQAEKRMQENADMIKDLASKEKAEAKSAPKKAAKASILERIKAEEAQ